MKGLLIGILAIVVLGFMFFAFQIVRNSDFSSSVRATQTVSPEKDTYIDINRNQSFEYPKGWVMHDPKLVQGYAPIFRNQKDISENNIGYIAFGIKPIKKNSRIEEDMEMYSSELPINNAIKDLVASTKGDLADNQIEIGEVKKVSYKNGSSGFTVDFSGNYQDTVKDSGDDQLWEGKFSGKVYYFYTLQGLELAFSIFIEKPNELLNQNSTSTPAEVLPKAQDFLNQAQETLINIIRY